VIGMQRVRWIFAILASGIGAVAAADEPAAIVTTSIRESLNEARGSIRRGRPDLAIRALRQAQGRLRAGEQGLAAEEWDRKLQVVLIEAVRAEERIEAGDEVARRGVQRREAVADLPGAAGREDALQREHERIMAQVGGIGGGGPVGGGGVVGGVGGGGFAVGGGRHRVRAQRRLHRGRADARGRAGRVGGSSLRPTGNESDLPLQSLVRDVPGLRGGGGVVTARLEEPAHVEDQPPDLNDPPVAQAIAARALFAGLPGVRVAPDIAPGDWDFALNAYLPMHRDEAVIALIPSIGVGFTTKRVYWGPTHWWQRLWDPFRGRAIPYEEVRTRDIQRLGLHALPRVAASRVHVALRRLIEANRGNPPELSMIERELVEAEGPAVLAASAAESEGPPTPLSFFTELAEKTPRVVATPLLMLTCIAAFLAMVLLGRVSFWLPTSDRLLAWGADYGPLVVYGKERWRLITCMFVHGGIVHLAMNLWCLRILGPVLERALGLPAFLTLYFASGVGGALVSLWTHPASVSTGASGAIFGLLGALGGYLIANHRLLPREVRGPLMRSLLICVILNLLLGEMLPILDTGAHLGGLMIGFLGGLMLSRPWPIRRNPWGSVRWTLGTAALGAVLVAAYGSAGAAVRANPQARAWALNEAIPPEFTRFYDSAQWQVQGLDRAKNSLDRIFRDYARGISTPREAREECRRFEVWLKANRDQIRSYPLQDPALNSARDALAESFDQLRESFLAVRRMPLLVIRRRLTPQERVDHMISGIAETVRLVDSQARFRESRAAFDRIFAGYLKRKGLTQMTIASAGPPAPNAPRAPGGR
jgi:rhomboid protease GluP